MAKKTFKGGMDNLLGEGTKVKTPAQKRAQTIRAKWKALKEESDKIVINQTGEQTGEQTEKLKVGRPKTQFKEITKSSQEGTKENETRATFIVKEDLLEKLKAIAYWDRTLIKEVVDKALEEAVVKYEKKNGPVKALPKK
jgi:hypothetical protein